MIKNITPLPLDKGQEVAVISPAGAVEKGQFEKILGVISDQGYRPVLGKNVYARYNKHYHYAGDFEKRISDLQWALDGDFGAIWSTRGGYGCMHLLQYADLKEFRKNPKWYIGYSDNTAIQALLVKEGFSSIHGQCLKSSPFGNSKDSYEGIFRILRSEKPRYEITKHPMNRSGNMSGVLVGGNLALVCSLLGTPYSFDFKDNILFIEEVGEEFYALDRLLMQLELSEVFANIKGVIVGGMTKMGGERSNKNYKNPFDNSAYEIILERLKKYDFPVIFAFLNGHIYDNKPLIIGANVEIEMSEENVIMSFS